MKTFYRFMSFLLLLAVSAAGLLTVRAEDTAKRYYGDLDKNGTVDPFDARTVLRMATNLSGMPNEEDFLCADIDRNDIINTADARLILRMAAGVEPLEYMNSTGPGDTAGLIRKFGAYRSKNNLSALAVPDKLSAAAATLAEEFYRTGSAALRPDESYWFTAVTAAGISPLFADASFLKGAKGSDAVYTTLTADAKTLKNLKYSGFNSVGVGCYEAPDGYYYWCVIFANIA